MKIKYAKYGLQGEAFGTLPTLKAYQFFKQEKNIVTLNIQQELAALKEPLSTLHITVPTVGFTDPLLDYSPIPRFAIPLSINGYVADEANQLAATATVVANDIAGGSYPLLPEAEAHAAEPVFTTLSALTFIFKAQSCVEGCDLVNTGEANGMIEFFLCYPANTPLMFSLAVKDKMGKIILARDLCYYPVASVAPEAKFSESDTINCEARVGSAFDYFRSRWVCEFECDNASFRITHQAGLSYSSIRALLAHLLPAEVFFARFAQRNGKQATKNRYDLYPQYQPIFYEHVLESILNQSLPLLALEEYFKQDAHDARQLEILSSQWDSHDQTVFKRARRLPSLGAFVDALDELICLRDYLFSATLVPAQQGLIKVNQVTFSVEDKQGHWQTCECQHQLQPEIFSVYTTNVAKEPRYQEQRRK
ncbi:MAG: hypothetical protein AB7I18_04380 [Candidatus Berkiella sp.]